MDSFIGVMVLIIRVILNLIRLKVMGPTSNFYYIFIKKNIISWPDKSTYTGDIIKGQKWG